MWYEDVVGIFSDISSSPFHVHPYNGNLDLSIYVSQLLDEIKVSLKRPYQPHNLIGFHASQLLAHLAVSSNPDQLTNYKPIWVQCNQLLHSLDSIPAHLGPLLTFYALSDPCKETLDFIIMCMNSEHLGVHWSIRAEALLALDRLLSKVPETSARKLLAFGIC